MNIRVRGISYHFDIHQEIEKLPYLVLLHGFMGSGRQFDHLIPRLKKFCNPITIDQAEQKVLSFTIGFRPKNK